MSSLLSDRDKALVSNFLLGGAAVGGSAALATALVNYLKHLNKNEAEEDDETIRIYKKPIQQEKVAMSLGGPLAITGGLLSSAGTYALVNKLYQALRKKQAQEELDAAQDIFLDSQGYSKEKKKKTEDKEVEKSASEGKPMSLDEFGLSLPVALPLLMALGSGVVAHKMLDKTFPLKKKPVVAPKRIEIVDAPVDETDEEAEKSAGVSDSDGFEFLLRTISLNKKATSDVNNLIATAADGRIADFKKAASVMGYADALDTVKGAAKSVKPDAFTEQVAISCLAKSAAISEQTKLLAAGEFAEMYPSFFKLASELPAHKQTALYKIACILGNAIRSEISENAGITSKPMDKKASMDGTLLETLLDSDSDKVEEKKPKKQKSKFVYSSKRGLRLAKKLEQDDVIDKILNPNPEEA